MNWTLIVFDIAGAWKKKGPSMRPPVETAEIDAS
jgi:hypothetical protein